MKNGLLRILNDLDCLTRKKEGQGGRRDEEEMTRRKEDRGRRRDEEEGGSGRRDGESEKMKKLLKK